MQHPVTMNASPLYLVISLIPVVYFSDSLITKLQTTYGWLDRVGAVLNCYIGYYAVEQGIGTIFRPKQSHSAIRDMSLIQA